jgi:hypothetical protein
MLGFVEEGLVVSQKKQPEQVEAAMPPWQRECDLFCLPWWNVEPSYGKNTPVTDTPRQQHR